MHGPALNFPPELLLHARHIRLAFFDIDGVMTDGGLHYSESGETLKRFNSLDGLGLKLLAQAGITPAVITGRDSPALRLRLQGLGITEVRFGIEDKLAAAQDMLQALGLQWEDAAAIGDDWPDLPVMRRCSFAAAPPHAHEEVRAMAAYITRAAGGHGAVREFCDVLMVASGRYARLLQEYAR